MSSLEWLSWRHAGGEIRCLRLQPGAPRRVYHRASSIIPLMEVVSAILMDRSARPASGLIGLSGHWLTMFYNSYGAKVLPKGVKSHMNRDVGLAWLDLPLILPVE